jgi:hypothetical protein
MPTHKRHFSLPGRIYKWSLTSLQQRLLKTGGRLPALQTRMTIDFSGARVYISGRVKTQILGEK